MVVASIVALALAQGAQALLLRGTLTGVVKRGPIAPVCVAEQPCDEPAPHVTLLFSRAGAVVAHVVTDRHGRFRVRLRAGVYGVRRPGGTTIARKLAPDRVRVWPGRVVQIEFSIDTGIR